MKTKESKVEKQLREIQTEEFISRHEIMEHLSNHLFEIYPGKENITKRLECWDEWKNSIPFDKNWFTLKELREIKCTLRLPVFTQ